jgi:sugar lactone lactonase YvrE
MKTLKAENVAPLGLECGEVPLWVPEEGLIYFVDTEAGALYTYELESRTVRVIPVPYQLQCIARREKGGWIGTSTRGVVACDVPGGACKYIGNPIQGKRGMLFNDGTVTPEGDFIFGVYDVENLYDPNGSLYIVDSDLNITLVESGFAIPNGMAFSPDDTVFYLSEQFGSRVLRFDWDPKNKKLSNRQVFKEFPEEEGMPDGLIIDSDGYVWVAHWWGSKVSRFNPDGGTDLEIPLPVKTATCMVFAGRNLDQLYITTARKAVDEKDLKQGPEGGDLFLSVPGCTGRLEKSFKHG